MIDIACRRVIQRYAGADDYGRRTPVTARRNGSSNVPASGFGRSAARRSASSPHALCATANVALIGYFLIL